MRLYYLCRKEDISGASGTGRIAEVAEFDDRTVVVRWIGHWNTAGVASTTVFNSLNDLLKVHGHQGRTDVELIAETGDIAALEMRIETLREALRRSIECMNAHNAPVPAEVARVWDRERVIHGEAALPEDGRR